MHTRCPTRGLPSAARLTKHRTPTSCVPLCTFAASRKANRLQPGPAASISRQSGCTGQISGCKARATCIRVHSCPFVVQNHPCIPHCDYPCKSVLIRGEMAHARPWPRACSGNTINRTRAGKPELHSFVFIRVHSRFKPPPFVVQFTSIRGSNRPADNSATNRN